MAHPEWPSLTIVGVHSWREILRNHLTHDLLGKIFYRLALIFRHEFTLPSNLRVVQSPPIAELRRLQLASGVHVCPSEQEGFGHYINEARALSALVITTNHPPMNEFIVDNVTGILVQHDPPFFEGYQGMAPYFKSVANVRKDHICTGVSRVLAMDTDARKFMGKKARAAYEFDTNVMASNLINFGDEALARLK
ncbi:hypothetical protein HK100_010034 [Physocladia obscura]|uniref:Glycosyl transferase family 1 domain-containing protein n=1 Tax=Physocladia obscura TaxID=109957 RepID=A0AAD5XJ12_9FUNG|nr:hypothetical protein HK100_010034 [Physocladia obscura]